MAFQKTKEITECYCCGGTNLSHVDIDPETIDTSSESVHFDTGYHCEKCGNISHTDGNEESFTITRRFDSDYERLTASKPSDVTYWPSKSGDPRKRKETA